MNETIISFDDRSEAYGWIYDRKNPERFFVSSGFSNGNNAVYHVCLKSKNEIRNNKGISVDLNNLMRFRPSKKAWDVLRDWGLDIDPDDPEEYISSFFPLKEDGRIECQIWQYMQALGQHHGNGTPSLGSDYELMVPTGTFAIGWKGWQP